MRRRILPSSRAQRSNPASEFSARWIASLPLAIVNVQRSDRVVACDPGQRFIEGPRPLTPTLSHKGRGGSPPFGCAFAGPVAQSHYTTSQLPGIAEGERGDAAGVLVEDQGAGDWRLG